MISRSPSYEPPCIEDSRSQSAPPESPGTALANRPPAWKAAERRRLAGRQLEGNFGARASVAQPGRAAVRSRGFGPGSVSEAGSCQKGSGEWLA